MILVVVGSTSIPFDRLLRGIDELAADEPVLVQRGPSSVVPKRCVCVEFMPFEEMVENVRTARVVITHCGVGIILVSLMNGKRPVVVPRLRRFGEAVDDHQLELGQRLAQDGLVTLVDDASLLSEAIAAHDGSTGGRLLGSDGALARELRERILVRVEAGAASASASR
jgi:UDP-N-acetylglucosamine transferase subunit ALG13